MFGLGPTELIVILILGVLLLGPQRIPEVASSLGKAIRSFRRATRELRDQIDIEDEVRRPLEDLRVDLVAQLRTTESLFEGDLPEALPRVRAAHPLYGSNNVVRMLRLMGAHEERHQHQLRAILKQL